jgi:uncharacterized protein YyaL (SSP411 family)
MTGSGGWPLNAVLTPEGVPFYAGTYFPPTPRQGMPAWSQVVQGVHQAWVEQRGEIVEAAQRMVQRLAASAELQAPDADLDPAALDDAVAGLRRAYDGEFGGWGGAPKFPAASVIEFLLARGEREMALGTLRRMASGGMYDQVAGGFARYSVDRRWIVPHFEKMLYDNALLARAYLHAFQLTGEPLFERVTIETLGWALRELRQPEGGFASALDADADGEEGSFTVWTLDEVRHVLGDALAPVAIEHFGMTEAGNFEGRNIPVRATPDPPEREEIRARLLEARERRVHPGLDDKRLTAWNALMISALADAGAVLGRTDYLEAAEGCATFVLRDLRTADGALLRSFNRGAAKQPAFLEDHAFLLEALLTLYEATFDERWFTEARRLADTILARFADSERGGFFSTATDAEPLIARRKDIDDAPIPSGSSSAAFGLLRLARLTGEARYEDAALGAIRLLAGVAPRHPNAFGHLLQAIDFALAPVREVAVVGPDADPLLAVVRGAYRPHLVVAGGEAGGGAVPLLEGRGPVDGRAAAFVCERFACRTPVTEPDELAALLS